jgi:asparagine synthase (glutamine-hydrolysing)
MCGIAGMYPDPRPTTATFSSAVAAMCSRMAARGPDAQGIAQVGDARLVLGHRRLSIIDLDARANQPMLSPDAQYAIVFNGEIYNYRELRAELTREGEAFQTSSDTEVLLTLYRLRGEAMLSELRGMFAFAIWDGKKRALFLARDPYGIKPLYYAQTPSGLVFASQVKALLSSGLVSTETSPAGLAGFYLWGSVPEPWSMYRDIKALPAGHVLWVKDGVAGAPRSWYDIRKHWRDAGRRCTAAELQERVRDAVVDSVRAHRVADVPVSVFLSGGIDSGAITGVLASQGTAVEGITIGFSEFSGRHDDEVPTARAIASHYGLQHHVRMVSRAEFETDLPRILDAMDQPSIDGVNTWFASKAAAERGYKVVLSGVGGDELLCGYPSFHQIPRAAIVGRSILRLPGARRALARLGALAAEHRNQPKLKAIASQLDTLEGVYQLRRGVFMPPEIELLMGTRAAAEGLRALGEFAECNQALARDAGAAVGLLESTLYLRNQLLRDSDWASMAHSLELRTPLVDARLLEALGPYVAGFAHGQGKAMLAKSAEPPLTSAIITRKKTGFSLPMASWLTEAAAAHVWAPLPSLSRPGTPWARRWGHYIASSWL